MTMHWIASAFADHRTEAEVRRDRIIDFFTGVFVVVVVIGLVACWATGFATLLGWLFGGLT